MESTGADSFFGSFGDRPRSLVGFGGIDPSVGEAWPDGVNRRRILFSPVLGTDPDRSIEGGLNSPGFRGTDPSVGAAWSDRANGRQPLLPQFLTSVMTLRIRPLRRGDRNGTAVLRWDGDAAALRNAVATRRVQHRGKGQSSRSTNPAIATR
jgi:hypothetical protein